MAIFDPRYIGNKKKRERAAKLAHELYQTSDVPLEMLELMDKDKKKREQEAKNGEEERA